MTTKICERLELGPHAASEARAVLRRLERAVPRETFETLRLLVSELVTNSFRHAGLGPGGVAVLTVNVDPDRVLVQVEDHGKGFRFDREPQRRLDRESGWGLTIVQRLSDRWGVRRNGSTVVWFELLLSEARIEAARRAAGDAVVSRGPRTAPGSRVGTTTSTRVPRSG